MINALIHRYAGLAVPRYTSYPTAAEFSASIGPAEHARWLETLDPSQRVSLYLHVPYCREICHYCGCTTKAVTRDEVLAGYREVLEAEIGQAGPHLLRAPPVARLHWGGGTPAVLANDFGFILDKLAKVFVLQPGFEHAIELDPRGVTPALAKTLVRLGVNRVSLGVQDLDPSVQIAIGRVQPFGVVEEAFKVLRDAGLERINVDLIYGLPRQTEASVRETARRIAALDPSRIASYGYAHLPSRKRNQRLINTSELPNMFERFAQARGMAEAFAEGGYEAIGIDHFAKPDDALAQAAQAGRLHRNFQGYTDDNSDILLGFGASSISRLGEGFVQNIADPTAYARAVRDGRLATARGHRFSDEDRIRSAIIESLMCRFEVDLRGFSSNGDFSDELALLRPLVSDGIVVQRDGRVSMTAIGRPFVRVVAAVFDAFRQDTSNTFSVAV